jgi:hypothetical protein
VVDFRGAEAVNIKLREARFYVAQQFFVPLELEFRVQAALHENLIAAKVERFLNLLVEFIALEYVAFRRLRPPVESAEIADGGTDVCVIDVAVDVVGAVVLWVQAAGDFVGGAAEGGEIMGFQQPQTFGRSQPLAGHGFREQIGVGLKGNHLFSLSRKLLSSG